MLQRLKSLPVSDEEEDTYLYSATGKQYFKKDSRTWLHKSSDKKGTEPPPSTGHSLKASETSFSVNGSDQRVTKDKFARYREDFFIPGVPDSDDSDSSLTYDFHDAVSFSDLRVLNGNERGCSRPRVEEDSDCEYEDMPAIENSGHDLRPSSESDLQAPPKVDDECAAVSSDQGHTGAPPPLRCTPNALDISEMDTQPSTNIVYGLSHSDDTINQSSSKPGGETRMLSGKCFRDRKGKKRQSPATRRHKPGSAPLPMSADYTDDGVLLYKKRVGFAEYSDEYEGDSITSSWAEMMDTDDDSENDSQYELIPYEANSSTSGHVPSSAQANDSDH